MAGGVISPLYTGVKARRNGTPCITLYIYIHVATVHQFPPTRNQFRYCTYISVYRKLRGGSVKSCAANGRGQTCAETWEIAPLFSPIHARFMHGLAKTRLMARSRCRHEADAGWVAREITVTQGEHRSIRGSWRSRNKISELARGYCVGNLIEKNENMDIRWKIVELANNLRSLEIFRGNFNFVDW